MNRFYNWGFQKEYATTDEDASSVSSGESYAIISDPIKVQESSAVLTANEENICAERDFSAESQDNHSVELLMAYENNSNSQGMIQSVRNFFSQECTKNRCMIRLLDALKKARDSKIVAETRSHHMMVLLRF